MPPRIVQQSRAVAARCRSNSRQALAISESDGSARRTLEAPSKTSRRSSARAGEIGDPAAGMRVLRPGKAGMTTVCIAQLIECLVFTYASRDRRCRSQEAFRPHLARR